MILAKNDESIQLRFSDFKGNGASLRNSESKRTDGPLIQTTICDYPGTIPHRLRSWPTQIRTFSLLRWLRLPTSTIHPESTTPLAPALVGRKNTTEVLRSSGTWWWRNVSAWFCRTTRTWKLNWNSYGTKPVLDWCDLFALSLTVWTIFNVSRLGQDQVHPVPSW